MADKKKQKAKDSDLEDYARQIWLAGLGAYTRLGKEGSKLFETLISEGEEAEKLASKVSLDGAKDKVKKARRKLTDKLSDLEERFDKGKQGAAERLGLASQADLEALAERVDQLTNAVEKLSTSVPAAKPATKAATSRARPATTAKAAPAKADAQPAATGKPASRPATKTAEQKPATEAKAAPRRRATAPKAATRGKTSPAPATDAVPGNPPEL